MTAPELKRYTQSPYTKLTLWDAAGGEYVRFADVDAYTQAAIAAAMMGAVKPLEFIDEYGDGTLTARSANGLFRIFKQGTGGFFAPALGMSQASSADAQILIDRLNAKWRTEVLSALSIPTDAMAALEAVKAQVREEVNERAARIVEALTVSPVRNQPEKWPDYLRSREHGDNLLAKRADEIRGMREEKL